MAGAPCPRQSAITENALYEAGCDDALIAVVNDTMFLKFHRNGLLFEDAVKSTSRDVELAGDKVVRVVPTLGLARLTDPAARLTKIRASQGGRRIDGNGPMMHRVRIGAYGGPGMRFLDRVGRIVDIVCQPSRDKQTPVEGDGRHVG